MRYNKVTGIYAALVGIVMILIVLSGCSEKITNNSPAEPMTIKVAVKWPTAGSGAFVEQFRVIVTAEDMAAPLIFPMIIEDGFLWGVVIVPMGDARTFTVEAADKMGVVLYKGTAVADIGFASLTELDINLFPVQPMVYITPHYQDVSMGNQFAIDLVVHDIPNLSTITVDLQITDSPTRFLLLGKGQDLDTADDVWWEHGGLFAAVGAYSRDTVNGIVDEAGNARFATITFESHGDWPFDTVTAFIQFTINSLWSTLGEPIPETGIYTDFAVVMLNRGIIGINSKPAGDFLFSEPNMDVWKP